MKKQVESEEMRGEYRRAGGVKNPFAARAGQGTNLVLIEPEVFKAFPNADAVNQALRILLKAGAQAVKPKGQRQAKAS